MTGRGLLDGSNAKSDTLSHLGQTLLADSLGGHSGLRSVLGRCFMFCAERLPRTFAEVWTDSLDMRNHREGEFKRQTNKYLFIASLFNLPTSTHVKPDHSLCRLDKPNATAANAAVEGENDSQEGSSGTAQPSS